MPTYEYRCKSCSHEFEIVQSFSDDALTRCDECGGTLRKVFGNVGISFKGTGFYKNDHGSRSSNGDSNGGSESKTEFKSDTKSETKTESKSETKSESKSEAKSASSPAPSTA